MSEPLLALLKLCLLALIYLFFLRVLRAVWVETRTPAPAMASAGPARVAATPTRRERRRAARAPSTQLIVVEPTDHAGRTYDLDRDATIGRAAGSTITIDDGFASQLHARIFTEDGQVMVEDLGSTNGTYLNRQRVVGVMAMQPGDHVQIGNTILELR